MLKLPRFRAAAVQASPVYLDASATSRIANSPHRRPGESQDPLPRMVIVERSRAAIPFTIKRGGYGSWLSPGRQLSMWRHDCSGVEGTARPRERRTSGDRCRGAGELHINSRQDGMMGRVDPTTRRVANPSTVVLAKARTHYPGWSLSSDLGPRSFSQSYAVVMGPGFRQDDSCGCGDRTA